jgi:hypothetical protein
LLGTTRVDPTKIELAMHRNRSGSERELRERERVPAAVDDILEPEAMVVDGVSVGGGGGTSRQHCVKP